MPITRAPQLRYRNDSARVENWGPCMHTYDAAPVERHSHRLAGVPDHLLQARADRVADAHVADDAVAEEGAGPSPGPVDELVRQADVARDAASSSRLPTADSEITHSTPRDLSAQMLAR